MPEGCTQLCYAFSEAAVSTPPRHRSYSVMVMAFSVEMALTWADVSLATIFFSPTLVGVHIISDLMILPGFTSLRRKKKQIVPASVTVLICRFKSFHLKKELLCVFRVGVSLLL